MDNETNGRLLALEELVSELILKLPRNDAAQLLSSALSGLQRQPSELVMHATRLPAAISMRLPRA